MLKFVKPKMMNFRECDSLILSMKKEIYDIKK